MPLVTRASWINLAVLIGTAALLVALLVFTDISELKLLAIAVAFILAVAFLQNHGEIVLRRGRYPRR